MVIDVRLTHSQEMSELHRNGAIQTRSLRDTRQSIVLIVT